MPTQPVWFNPGHRPFWVLFFLVTLVGLLPTITGTLIVGACGLGNCAVSGVGLWVLESVVATHNSVSRVLAPQVAPLIQIIGPIATAGLAAMTAPTNATPGSTSHVDIRRMRNLSIAIFVIAALLAMINFFYFGTGNPDAPLVNRPFFDDVSNPKLYADVADTNLKSFQGLISNLLVLVGLKSLEQPKPPVLNTP